MPDTRRHRLAREGRFLLCRLLASPVVDMVHVLVRENGNNNAAAAGGATAGGATAGVLLGMERLREVAERYKVADAFKAGCSKIIVVCGSLEARRFGLSDADFDTLASKVDVVVHNAADVHWKRGYDALKATNVDSTVDIIQLCATGELAKRLVYVSSIAAIMPHEYQQEQGQFTCENTEAMRLLGGYGQSKRVSSCLVQKAREAGLDAVICSPGTIGGSLCGACNPADAINRFLASICELEMVPSSGDDGVVGQFSVLPVDFVSDMISGLAVTSDAREDARNNCYTIVGPPVSLSTITEACREWASSHHAEIKTVSVEIFSQSIGEKKCSLTPLAEFFQADVSKYAISNEAEKFNHLNTRAWCERYQLHMPTVSTAEIHRYLWTLMGGGK